MFQIQTYRQFTTGFTITSCKALKGYIWWYLVKDFYIFVKSNVAMS